MEEQSSRKELIERVHFWKRMWYTSIIWGSVMTLVFIVFIALAPILYCGTH